VGYRIELFVSTRFSARVAIPDHDGVCRRPHGYRFRVEAGVEGVLDPEKPWVLDLHTIEENLREVVSSLEGQDLNNFIPYPSLEGVALWIYDRLKDRLPSLKRILLEAPPRYRVVLKGEKM